MTRKYETPGPDGQPVEIPADLLEKIADDVRAFDRSESPEGRAAYSLKKITAELPRIRDAINGRAVTMDQRRLERFRITVLAIQAAQASGYSEGEIRMAPPVKELLDYLGLSR